jgi:hypothetical protein
VSEARVAWRLHLVRVSSSKVHITRQSRLYPCFLSETSTSWFWSQTVWLYSVVQNVLQSTFKHVVCHGNSRKHAPVIEHVPLTYSLFGHKKPLCIPCVHLRDTLAISALAMIPLAHQLSACLQELPPRDYKHVLPNVASRRSSVLVPYRLDPKLPARGVVPKLRARAVQKRPMKLLSVRCWWRAPRRPPTRIQGGSSPPVTKHHMAPQSSNNKQYPLFNKLGKLSKGLSGSLLYISPSRCAPPGGE